MIDQFALRLVLLLLFSLLNFTASFAQFYTLRTKYMRLVYYSQEHAYIVPHLTRSFENSLSFHRGLFNYEPTEEVLVFLQDFDDYGYAGATGLPINYMILGIEPYEYIYEVSPINERINWVMNHELTHVVAIDKGSKSDNVFRSMFLGKVSPTSEHPISMFYSYLTNPRKYSPRWYHEGVAVFLETWMSGGIGRALGGYDEMVFRTMVRDSSYFYDFVGLESEGTTIDFQIGANAYLYGTRFVTYLAYHYSPEKLLEWFTRTDSSRRYFESQFARVYGVSIDEEWSKWIAWEQEWQKANLDSIRQYQVTEGRPICSSALGAVSQAFYDSSMRKLFLAANYPGQIAQIASISVDDCETKRLADLTTPALFSVASTAYDPSTRTYFFTTHNVKGWRDIYALDVMTGKTRQLLKNARIGDLAFNHADKSLWGVQHHNGTSRLMRIPHPYTHWEELLSIKYGIDIYDLDVSPDGKYITASMFEVTGRHHLVRFEVDKLLAGESDYEFLYEFENTSPLNFVFSPDGKFLFGTTYYTGVSNVVRYDFEKKQMEWISNCETGFFRPIPISPESLIVFRYTGKGFVPEMIANEVREDVSAVRYLGQQVVEKHPIVKEWKLNPPSPAFINFDSLTISSGEYSGLANIRLASAYPIIEGYKDYTAVGWRFNLLDPLLLHGLDVSASYSPSRSVPLEERFHGTLNYSYWGWTFHGTYNGADFYDLFGPTKNSRKGSSLSARYGETIFDEKPGAMDYSVSLSGYAGLERQPEFQNVPTSFDKFLTFTGKLNYSYLLWSLGAVDVEKGIRVSLNFQSTYLFRDLPAPLREKIFPRVYLTLHHGIPLPIRHSSLWFRASAGKTFGDRDDPFANFYFGGFGNNWVDYASEKRYREYYSFPGVELNTIAGANFGKLLVEWNLPPIRFRRLGFPAIYCNWSRIALFSSGIVTDIDVPEDKTIMFNTGAQVDFKLVIFSNLESTLSFGYAVAFDREKIFDREVMASLKILR